MRWLSPLLNTILASTATTKPADAKPILAERARTRHCECHEAAVEASSLVKVLAFVLRIVQVLVLVRVLIIVRVVIMPSALGVP